VLLKECLTYISKHNFCDALIKFSYSKVKDLMRLSLFKTLKIKFFDIIQREIIHFLNVTKLGNNKIQNSSSNCDI